MSTNSERNVLAYIPIGGGSSWGFGVDITKAVGCAITALQDWGRMFNIHETQIKCGIYDLTGFTGFDADDRGIWGTRDDGTQSERPLKLQAIVKVTTPKKDRDTKKHRRALEEAAKTALIETR